MGIEDDETLKMYVEESLEHLGDIENDLLAIEAAGAEIDEELVNKVFRAAHSIKGGAGFMGLNNIKELAHKMENVLGMIRSREMIPNQEITNILLLASDDLRNLISNVSSSNEIDISEHTEALTELATNSLPDEEKESVSKMVDVSFPDGKPVFTLAEYDISNVRKKGKFIYLVEFDLIHDVHQKDKMPLNLLREMEKSGEILDCKIDIDTVGALEDDVISNRLPFLVLFATILDPEMINALFEVEEKYIFELAEDFTIKPIGEESSAEISVSQDEGSKPTVKEVSPIEEENNDNVSKSPSRPAAVTGAESAGGNVQKGAKGKAEADSSLRVNVSLLDSLMNLAGELVLGRNQLLQAIASKDARTTDAAGQRLDLITTELQEAIMLTRMQPIGSVFNKFPRVVRDLAGDLGKQVELILEGKDVELDKTIIEAINDPLTHLVRNSVDHGIEGPDERRRVGKEPTGKVLLKAYHEAGQVNIEISDDGKGLDGNGLASSAVAKGLISEGQVRVMSDREKVNLIFLPGFSTAEKVTDVSGRGVGMDVVKTNLDKLGGVVDIDSHLGGGTSFRIKLPLTLAIIPSQMVSTGGERFAIPQVNMDELLRIPASQVKERLEKVGDAEVVRLRGRLLPLLSLTDVLGMEKTYIDPTDGKEKPDRRKGIAERRSRRSPLFEADAVRSEQPQIPDSQSTIDNQQSKIHAPRNPEDRRHHVESAVNVVVVSTGALKYGLVVDSLHDSEEIVVKPLGRHLVHCKGYAGATILGDGRVALILDVVGLSQMAELMSMEGTDRAADVAREAVISKEDAQSLLIFRNAVDEQFAVPLGFVQRIEKIRRADIEQVGGKRVIQYRGGSLPLSAIEEVADVKPLADKEEIIVIVFLIADREAGLLATGPVDAVDLAVDFDETILKQPGIMGSAVIGDHTTLMVDIYGMMKTLNPYWFSEREQVQTSDGRASTILYAEDSEFFRNQVKGFMEDEGHRVIEAEDGVVAWNLLQEHANEISLVVTDIEMPGLDGYGLTEKIKKDERFAHLKVIALTSLAGEEDIARGKEVGIDEYQLKLDGEKLMVSIYNFLKER